MKQLRMTIVDRMRMGEPFGWDVHSRDAATEFERERLRLARPFSIVEGTGIDMTARDTDYISVRRHGTHGNAKVGLVSSGNPIERTDRCAP
jgi:hypothetical protein